jgi:DNA modification methylase
LQTQTKTSSLQWHNEKRKVKDLTPCSYNPRKITDEQKTLLKKSLTKFNVAEIPAINTDGTIIAGHMRIMASIENGRGDEIIDVRVPNRELTKEEADEYMLASNRITGEWDFLKLAKFNTEMLKSVGFSSFEMDKILLRVAKEDNFDAQKEYEKIQEPETKKGDLYLLGNHRLLCGSSVDEQDFEKLMDGKKGNLIFTDPPYNINYKSPAGFSYDSKKFGGTGGKILNDNLSDKDCLQFYTDVLKNLFIHTDDSVTIYWWVSSVIQHISQQAFELADWHFSQIIIWLKNSVSMVSKDYLRTYENCIVGWKNGKAHYIDKRTENYKDVIMLDKETFAEQLDVWYEHRDNTSKYLHPTQKPVRLSERAIKKNSKSGDIVIDAFGGSGSTLIGCSQLDRKCFAMELDPKYCDVIVKRYEKYTGKKAERVK